MIPPTSKQIYYFLFRIFSVLKLPVLNNQMFSGESEIADLTGYYSALFNAKRNQTVLNVSYGIATDFHLSHSGSLRAVKNAIATANMANSYHRGTVESENWVLICSKV